MDTGYEVVPIKEIGNFVTIFSFTPTNLQKECHLVAA